MSQDVELDIDLDEGYIIIWSGYDELGDLIPHRYDIEEVKNDLIDRLIQGGATYTVYSQVEETNEPNEEEDDKDE